MKSGTIPQEDLEYYLRIEDLALEQIGAFLYCEGVTWKIYSDPRRDDNVFVAEDKELIPYVYSPRYPLVPDTKHICNYGLPEKFAEKLVYHLNVIIPKRNEEFQQLFKNPEYKGKMIVEINK